MSHFIVGAAATVAALATGGFIPAVAVGTAVYVASAYSTPTNLKKIANKLQN